MLRLMLGTVLAAVCLCLAAGPGDVQAQDKKRDKTAEQSQLAKVVKVDGDTLTVTSRDPKSKKDVEKSIKVDKDVKLVSIKKGFKLADLKAGDEVVLIEKEGKVTEIRVVVKR